MAKRGVVRGFFGSLVNVKKWSNFDEVAASARFVTKSVKDLCQPQKGSSMSSSSFAEMMQKLNLTEDDIKKRMKYFLYYFVVYFFSALCLFFYMGYLIATSGRILSVLVTMILGLLMTVYAVREHFWYMQLKTRKLGCSFRDWLAFLLWRTK